MALTRLRQYSKADYDNLSKDPFAHTPDLTKGSNVDKNVSISPYGWVGDNVFVFTITTDAGNISTVNIGGLLNVLLVVNLTTEVNTPKTKTYWTVETERYNEKDNDWIIKYRVDRKGRKTGKWVFVKGGNISINPFINIIRRSIIWLIGILQALLYSLR